MARLEPDRQSRPGIGQPRRQAHAHHKGKNGKDGPKYSPVVQEATAPKNLRWRASMLGGLLFTNDRVFELSEKDGGTTLVHRERFSGLMATLSWNKLQGFASAILDKMNQALKDRLEA